MNITRVKAPKYRVGRFVLNEYEIRCLMAEVAKGQKPAGIVVRDIKGDSATILEDGRLSCNLYGFDICSRFTLEVIRIKRERAL